MATAGVVNFGTGSPSPAASVVKCYCHQCAKNFILVDQNTVSSCSLLIYVAYQCSVLVPEII